MKLRHDDQEKVINALKTAYHDQDTAEVGGQWQQNVMREIRRLGPLRQEANGSALYAYYLWRAVPVIALFIFILGGLAANFDVIAEYELSTLLIEDSVTTTSIDSFFLERKQPL